MSRWQYKWRESNTFFFEFVKVKTKRLFSLKGIQYYRLHHSWGVRGRVDRLECSSSGPESSSGWWTLQPASGSCQWSPRASFSGELNNINWWRMWPKKLSEFEHVNMKINIHYITSYIHVISNKNSKSVNRLYNTTGFTPFYVFTHPFLVNHCARHCCK